MGVGHECFFEEQSIIMSLQTDICSCKLNDNSVSSIFKTRRALVLHFVIKNQVIFKFQGILSTIFSDFFQNIQELVGKMNKVKKGTADESFELMILRTGVHCLIPYTTNSFT